MNPEPDPRTPRDAATAPRRLFLFEPGWRVGLKVGSQREFCYMMAPGQDYYHRFYDGEIFLYHGDEKLCLACAERRGLIAFEPRGLRESLGYLEIGPATSPDELEWSEAGSGEFELRT